MQKSDITLLIVDDEDNIREMLARHFKFKNFHVETAESSELALEILNRKKIDTASITEPPTR